MNARCLRMRSDRWMTSSTAMLNEKRLLKCLPRCQMLPAYFYRSDKQRMNILWTWCDRCSNSLIYMPINDASLTILRFRPWKLSPRIIVSIIIELRSSENNAQSLHEWNHRQGLKHRSCNDYRFYSRAWISRCMHWKRMRSSRWCQHLITWPPQSFLPPLLFGVYITYHARARAGNKTNNQP